MSCTLSLRMQNLVSRQFGLCYDPRIVRLSLHLNPCLGMVLLEFPFTSHIEKCGQQPLYVLQMLKVQALNRHKIFSFKIVVQQYEVAEKCNHELHTRHLYTIGSFLFYIQTVNLNRKQALEIYTLLMDNILNPELSYVNTVHSWQVVALHLLSV